MRCIFKVKSLKCKIGFRSDCFAYMSGIWIDVIRESFLFLRLVILDPSFLLSFLPFLFITETVDDLGVKTVRICHAKWLLFPEEGIIEHRTRMKVHESLLTFYPFYQFDAFFDSITLQVAFPSYYASKLFVPDTLSKTFLDLK